MVSCGRRTSGRASERASAYFGAKSNLPPLSIVVAGAVINNCKPPACMPTGRERLSLRTNMHAKSTHARAKDDSLSRPKVRVSRVEGSSVPTSHVSLRRLNCNSHRSATKTRPSSVSPSGALLPSWYVRSFVRCHYHKSQSWRNMSWRKRGADGQTDRARE